MATSSFLNPLELWRTGLTKLEAELNTLATGSLKQEPVVHALHRLTTLSLGVHRIVDRVIDDLLHRTNLPTHRDVIELAEAMRRIEGQLDRLLALAAPDDTVRRPARTRRPPPIEAPLPLPPPAAPQRRSARRRAS